MKKLLAILMAFVLAFSLVACSNAADEETTAKEDSKNAKEESTEVVEAFMDAYLEFDADKMEDCVIDKDDLPESLKMNFDEKVEEAWEETARELPPEMANYESDFENMFISVIERALDEVSYDIVETEKEDDDEYTVTVEVTLPDVESVDFDEILSSKDDEASAVLEEKALEYMESGMITAYSTEEEIMDLLMPHAIEIIEEAFDEIEFEITTEEIEFAVKLEDDEWLIDAKDSDLDELAEFFE